MAWRFGAEAAARWFNAVPAAALTPPPAAPSSRNRRCPPPWWVVFNTRTGTLVRCRHCGLPALSPLMPRAEPGMRLQPPRGCTSLTLEQLANLEVMLQSERWGLYDRVEVLAAALTAASPDVRILLLRLGLVLAPVTRWERLEWARDDPPRL